MVSHSAQTMPTSPKYVARLLQSHRQLIHLPSFTPTRHVSNPASRRWVAYRMLKRSLIQMLTNMISPPPPTPWTARPAINITMLTDTAEMSDPMKNMAAAASNTGFRPQISLNFPHVGTVAAFASR